MGKALAAAGLLALTATGFATSGSPASGGGSGSQLATCSPTGICTACKNCKYCGHCAKRGGTCSVCKKSAN